MVPGVPILAETVETGDKNRDVTQCHGSFGAESLRKIDAKDVELFQNGSIYEFYRLKVLTSFRNKGILQ